MKRKSVKYLDEIDWAERSVIDKAPSEALTPQQNISFNIKLWQVINFL